MPQQRVRIRLKAYDHRVLDDSAARILDAIEKTGATVAGPIPLPTEIRKYTVIRGPFVHKDGREQFEIRTHKRIMDLSDYTSRTVDTLTNLQLPSGVDVDVKVVMVDD